MLRTIAHAVVYAGKTVHAIYTTKEGAHALLFPGGKVIPVLVLELPTHCSGPSLNPATNKGRRVLLHGYYAFDAASVHDAQSAVAHINRLPDLRPSTKPSECQPPSPQPPGEP